MNTPVLIMHGGADKGASPLHSLRMAEALTTLGREYSLMIFAGDNHNFQKSQRTRPNGRAVVSRAQHCSREVKPASLLFQPPGS